jgi:hypothetical protein
MTISTLSALRTVIDSGQMISCHKEPVVAPFAGFPQIVGGRIYDYWESTGYPIAGINPSTAAGTLYSRASTGAMQMSTSSGTTYALSNLQATAAWIPTENTTGNPISGSTEHVIHIWDRLWANGALPLNTTARQSWVPPALTRYTSGEGLCLWLRLYSTQVVNDSNVTIEYVNSSGVSRTFTSFQPFTSNSNSMFYRYQAIPMPLQLGDRGIRSINAVTLGTASASGTYGFLITRYLGAYRVNTTLQPDSTASAVQSIFGGLPQFDGDACLTFGISLALFPAGMFYVQGTMPRIAIEAKVIPI